MYLWIFITASSPNLYQYIYDIVLYTLYVLVLDSQNKIWEIDWTHSSDHRGYGSHILWGGIRKSFSNWLSDFFGSYMANFGVFRKCNFLFYFSLNK